MPGLGKGGKEMKISLAITSYNRYEMTVESFAQVIDDPRIDDVVILDDCSTDNSYQRLLKHFKGNEKARVIRQVQNRNMSLNKKDAIAHCKNKYAIIFDSDNIIGQDYLDALYKSPVFDGNVANYIFCPDFAKPTFDYRVFSGNTIRRQEATQFIKNDRFNMLMNTANYVVHREWYLMTYRYNPEHLASDTIWHNYNHLHDGGAFYVVPGMEYFHRVHSGSGFLQDAGYNMKKSEEVRKLIMQL
jgi:glycosyltransferase involved in cell wall biosynthesis